MWMNSQGKGKDAGWPDVCLTPPTKPPIPVPYPNSTYGKKGTPTQHFFYVERKLAHTKKTKRKKTMGDFPGRQKGVISRTVGKTHKHRKGVSQFLIKNQAITRLTTPGVGNKNNCRTHSKVTPDQTLLKVSM